jgi:hypothetical protein
LSNVTGVVVAPDDLSRPDRGGDPRIGVAFEREFGNEVAVCGIADRLEVEARAPGDGQQDAETELLVVHGLSTRKGALSPASAETRMGSRLTAARFHLAPNVSGSGRDPPDTDCWTTREG